MPIVPAWAGTTHRSDEGAERARDHAERLRARPRTVKVRTAREAPLIHDPERRGRALAEFFGAVSPRLWADLEASGALPSFSEPAREAMRLEWDCFALYACVRGLVAAGGFNRETARAIDALHGAVLEGWSAEAASPAEFEERRARLAPRYQEYGGIGQDGGAAGAATVTARLGEAAARHLSGGEPDAALARMVGGLHEEMAEGAAQAVREAE